MRTRVSLGPFTVLRVKMAVVMDDTKGRNEALWQTIWYRCRYVLLCIMFSCPSPLLYRTTTCTGVYGSLVQYIQYCSVRTIGLRALARLVWKNVV
jgi:hypothetical protein